MTDIVMRVCGRQFLNASLLSVIICVGLRLFVPHLFHKHYSTTNDVSTRSDFKSLVRRDNNKSSPPRCTQDTTHGICFFGHMFCHAGYDPHTLCKNRSLEDVANPWYSNPHYCANLRADASPYDENVFELDVTLEWHDCTLNKFQVHFTPCAYLCYATLEAGVSQIPKELWRLYQKNENKLWRDWSSAASDRGDEHLQGFAKYSALPAYLGNYIEIGCGPFTQTQHVIQSLSDRGVNFTRLSLLDPGADSYKKSVAGCTYKDDTLLGRPVRVLSYGAEELDKRDELYGSYDTLLVVNVIEHVWDAYHFLRNMHRALGAGGILIFHDRFYPTPLYGDAVVGPGNAYHPIRVTRKVLALFLEQFEPLYDFQGQTDAQRQRQQGEVGFYFIGRKR